MISVDSIELYNSPKIISLDKAKKVIADLKKESKNVGLCHGGFDLVHPGHIKHFEVAKNLCDSLVVSLTADKFVMKRKGEGRPIYSEELRSYTIASLHCVDYVVITDFAKGVEVIGELKPSYYIKGPDYINKSTPGITAERAAIKEVGGEMKYTTEPPMSTTKIIDYVQNLPRSELLLIIDRDGTLIENNDFLGRNDDWREELRLKSSVVSFISTLQTKYKTTKMVVTNQAGVARGYFDCSMVEEINGVVNDQLVSKGIKIDNWQYCPDVDSVYANLKKDEIEFDVNFIKGETRRKPDTSMVIDALNEIGKKIENFNRILVLGDRHEDKELATNLKAKFVDVNGKSYEDLVEDF